jgi:nucleotide-binding universal stress UspA family protein
VYDHILIPTDGSPLSAEAIEQGVQFASEKGAKVSFLTVTEPFHVFSLHVDQVEDTPAEYSRHSQERAKRALAEASGVAQAAGVACEVIHTEDNQPYRAIIRTAEERGCDLIAMASHGRRGLSALVLGSETLKVLTHSAIPVLVYRSGHRTSHSLDPGHTERAPVGRAEPAALA